MLIDIAIEINLIFARIMANVQVRSRAQTLHVILGLKVDCHEQTTNLD